jgi:hypothetical protein
MGRDELIHRGAVTVDLGIANFGVHTVKSEMTSHQFRKNVHNSDRKASAPTTDTSRIQQPISCYRCL